ncbi:reverse transcriptase domain-containing protein [Tanacetum coccineum]
MDDDEEEDPKEEPKEDEPVPEPKNMNGFVLHMNPQPEGNINRCLIEDDDDELEEDVVGDDDEEEMEADENDEETGGNDDEDDAKVIHPYEEANPLIRPPSTSDEESEFAPPVVPIVDANDEPVPPVIQFGGNFHVGESSSTGALFTGNCRVSMPGLTGCNLESVHRGVKRLDRQMFDRYNIKIRMAKKFKENDFRMNRHEFDIIALDAAMPPKRTSTSEALAMTHAAIRKLVADSVATALEAQAATMASTNYPNSRPRKTLVARKCTYEKFMSCQVFYFSGTKGAVGIIRWFKWTESVFSYSNCAKKNKVKFVINTLTEEALFWWNSFAQPIGVKEAYKITWSEFKRLLIRKYCPQTKIKKMEEAITMTQELIEQLFDSVDILFLFDLLSVLKTYLIFIDIPFDSISVGTMTMSLMHQWHDTIYGGVIGSVWMHPRSGDVLVISFHLCLSLSVAHSLRLASAAIFVKKEVLQDGPYVLARDAAISTRDDDGDDTTAPMDSQYSVPRGSPLIPVYEYSLIFYVFDIIMPPKGMSADAIQKLVTDKVNEALAADRATRNNLNVAGAVELCHYFEKAESVFGISECAERRSEEIHRLENELRSLNLRDTNIAAYTQRFNELALLCPEVVLSEKKKVELYIKGLPENIKGKQLPLIPRGNYRDNSRHNKYNNGRQGSARAMTAAQNDGADQGGPAPNCNHCGLSHFGQCPLKCN